MVEAIISQDDSVERALRRAKRKCERAGILSDRRKHRHDEKPSERRTRTIAAARRRHGRRRRFR